MSLTLRGRKKDEFMILEQGNIIMATYETKFHALSIYATKDEMLHLFIK